jgi:hypothetical protein
VAPTLPNVFMPMIRPRPPARHAFPADVAVHRDAGCDFGQQQVFRPGRRAHRPPRIAIVVATPCPSASRPRACRPYRCQTLRVFMDTATNAWRRLCHHHRGRQATRSACAVHDRFHVVKFFAICKCAAMCVPPWLKPVVSDATRSAGEQCPSPTAETRHGRRLHCHRRESAAATHQVF